MYKWSNTFFVLFESGDFKMDSLLSLKSSDKMLADLKNAANSKQTAEQINEQRISFIYGSVKESANITRAKIKDILSEKQGIGS